MKIFKIIFISIGVILVILIAAAVIFIKTLDINQYKPQIISQAKSALNRDVNFEKASLDISLTRGVNLKIKNLVISEDPAFQKGDFLTVKDISVSVNVLAYLFQKTVDVPNILIDSPRITVIRQKDGSLNVQSLQPASGNAGGKISGAAAAPLALPAVLISSLKLENGVVTYIDRSFEPAVNLDVSDLTVTVSKISLTEAFPFVVEAAVLSAKKNIKVEGNAQFDLKTNEVTISGL
ncbi:MAG: AsmA family protein, partial [Candidatus Omnitrophica bacterium]|nr:AsmA family protein [Candidatus Omnitrophota bacterium]